MLIVWFFLYCMHLHALAWTLIHFLVNSSLEFCLTEHKIGLDIGSKIYIFWWNCIFWQEIWFCILRFYIYIYVPYLKMPAIIGGQGPFSLIMILPKIISWCCKYFAIALVLKGGKRDLRKPARWSCSCLSWLVRLFLLFFFFVCIMKSGILTQNFAQ